MRRTLVLTSEHAGHPFRRSLPPHVTRAMPLVEPEVAAAEVRRAPPEARFAGLTLADAKDFLLAYCAGLFAFSLFLA
jgi:hypothetical protein